MSVITVLGPVEASELGVVSPHEHLLIDLRNQYRPPAEVTRRMLSEQKVGLENLDILRRNPLALRDNLVIDDEELAVKEVLRYRGAGGDTVVDVTNIGLGRDMLALRRIARVTGVHIVAGCGYYYHDTHPVDMGERPISCLREQMVRDITVGVDGTDVRAGIIGEIGVSDELHPDEEKVLAAAAQTQDETGAAIQVHIFPWGKSGGFPLGLQVLDILAREGADLDRVAIDHVDVAMDINLDYCLEISRRGAYVEFDNFGHEFYVDRVHRAFLPGPFATDVQRVQAIKALIEAGHLSKILLATDICHKSLLHRYGGWGYDHILTNIVPMMRDYGLSDAEINALLRENPQRLLDISICSRTGDVCGP